MEVKSGQTRRYAVPVIDIGDNVAYPGFTDAHAHWIGDRNYYGIATPAEAMEAAISRGWTSISEQWVDDGKLRELEALAADGALAERLPGFTYRAAQREMAALVVAALESGRHTVIEAGTGIGKTFAYLLPVLLLERRAIISTGTHTLQDQLFSRDLPLLGSVVGRPTQVALLKGRGNYLCWHRLESALRDGTRDGGTLAALRALHAWGQTSDSGDLTELEDLADDHALRAQVTSTVDNCLGRECGHVDRCFVVEARRRAQAAEVVIVNHHLLLADLALKDSGFGELLPGTDAVIVPMKKGAGRWPRSWSRCWRTTCETTFRRSGRGWRYCGAGGSGTGDRRMLPMWKAPSGCSPGWPT